jgi:hypothetical protein
MRRILAAVFVANLAAPCLFMLFGLVRIGFLDPIAFSRIGRPDEFELVIFEGAVLITFMTVFPVSLGLAFLGRRLGWRSHWIYLLGGAVIGLGFNFLLIAEDWRFPRSPSDQSLYLANIVIGAICGWIYWAIATGGRSHAPIHNKP